MRLFKNFAFFTCILLGINSTSAQKMFGPTAGFQVPIVENNLEEIDFGSITTFGISTVKWRTDPKSRKFRITNISYRGYQIKNRSMAYMNQPNFVSARIDMFCFELGGGRVLGNYEMDDRFYPYFYFSILAGMGTESGVAEYDNGVADTYTVNSVGLELFNWSFGINKALGQRAVFRAETKIHTGFGTIPTLQATLQGSVLFKLY